MRRGIIVEKNKKLASEYYQPFKSTLPVVKVTDWNTIKKPDDPYVYRGF